MPNDPLNLMQAQGSQNDPLGLLSGPDPLGLNTGDKGSFKSGEAFHDTLNLGNVWNSFKGLLDQSKQSDQEAQKIFDKAQNHETLSPEEVQKFHELNSQQIKNARAGGAALADIAAGIPAMAVGGVHGIASGIYNMDASKGLETGSNTMQALMPSSLLGHQDSQSSPVYQMTMAPVTAVADTANAIPQGYGEILNAMGHPDAAQQVTDAGKLGIMAATGLMGVHEGMKPFSRRRAERAQEQARLQEALQRQQEQPVQAPVAEDVGTIANADDFNVTNPYDVGGHVSAAEEGRPTTIDNPQGELFGGKEEGSVIAPKQEDVNPDSLLNDQYKQNAVDYGLSLDQSEPVADQGVRHLDPDKGTVVQGMDTSVPTVDFPLKTEVLDKDPNVQRMREQIAAHEQQLEHLKERDVAPEQITHMGKTIHDAYQKLSDYLDKSYGITSVQDAYPKLVETGKETKLPIKRGFDARKFKKQGGAIDPKEIRDGFQSLFDRIKQQNESSQILGEAAKQAVKNASGLQNFKPKNQQAGAIRPSEIREGLRSLADRFRLSAQQAGVPETVIQAAGNQTTETPRGDIHNKVEALKQAGLGRGLEDFNMPSRTPQEVKEMNKQFPDIERKLIQENIENGSMYRVVATKHPIVQYVSTQLREAQQAATRKIRDLLTDPDTGYKGMMRKLSPDQKASIWAVMAANEGQRIVSPEMLRELNFSQDQINFAMKHYEVDRQIFNDFNAARAQLDLPPIDSRLSHIAGRFLGDFKAMAKRPKLDKNNNPVFDVNGLPETEYIGHIGGNTRGEVKRIVKFMQERHPDWQFEKVEYKPIAKGASATDRFTGLMGAVETISKDNPNIQELVDAYKEFDKSTAQKFLNFQRHAKDKKAVAMGIVGSEGNKPWLDAKENAKQGMKAQLAYMEQAMQWTEMQKAASNIREVIDDPQVIERSPNAVGWSHKQLDHVFGRNMGWLADAANGMMNAVGEFTGLGHTNLMKGSNYVKHLTLQKFMGFMNIPFTITQIMQPLQSLPPMMMLMKTRGVEASMLKATINGLNTMMKFSFDTMVPREGVTPFSRFENEALDYAHANHVFDVQMIDHTVDINASKFKEMFDRAVDFNIKYPEIVTRGVTYLSLAHALKDAGYDTTTALRTAHNMTQIVMGDYTPPARPQMYDKMGGLIGDTASTLARYKHGDVNRWTMYGREAREGLKRGEIKASIPLATHIATTVALSGIFGVVGYQSADELYRLFSTHVLGKPDSITDAIMRNTNVSTAISHGVFANLGVDMTSHFSNANVIPNTAAEFLMPYGSALAEMADSGMALADNPNSFNVKRFGKAVAPSSMQGYLENKWFSVPNKDGTYGVINSRVSTNTRPPERLYDRTTKDMELRKFGFKPLHESMESTHEYQFKLNAQAATQRRNKIIQNAIEDYLSGKLSKTRAEMYGKRYTKTGSDQFDRDLEQAIQATNLTNKQRIVLRNAGGSYTGSYNLQQFYNPGYSHKEEK